MKTEVTEQLFRAAPAVGGTAYAGFTLNQWVAVATGIYIVLQGLYLARKWYREEKDWAAKGRRKGRA